MNPGARLPAGIILAVAMRPRLWISALRILRSHAALRWWRYPPFMPVPARSYLQFRAETQFGEPRPLTAKDVGDVLKYLEWVREWNKGA